MVAGRGAKEGRPAVVVTAATLRVPETRAELSAVAAGAERRPAVVVTAGSETLRRTVGDADGVGGETCGRVTAGRKDPRRTEGTEGEPGGRALADEWERTIEELDESDIRACGGILPLGRTGLASGTLGQAENGNGLAGGTLMQGSDVDAGGDDLLRGVVIADCGEAFPARPPPPPPSAAPPPRGWRARSVKV